jgi:NADH:ubiquinone oxidoreductase subunit H
MVFIGFIIITIFIGGLSHRVTLFPKVLLILYLFVWVRLSYPRTRYDKLIAFCWVIILPVRLLSLMALTRILI